MMRKEKSAVVISCLLLVATVAVAIGIAKGATPGVPKNATTAAQPAAERYLHVKVEGGEKAESVNVNLPLSMAIKILPAINHGELHNGRVTISKADFNDVDVKTILDAVRTAPDNEFVTVNSNDEDVRVAKSNGNLIIKIRDSGKRESKADKARRENVKSEQNHKNQQVDITVPMKVVDALFSTAKQNELDIAAAVRALDEAGDALLVTVHDAEQNVRIWIDSKTSAK